MMGKSTIFIFLVTIAYSILITNCNKDIKNSKFNPLVKKNKLFDKIFERQKRDGSVVLENATTQDVSYNNTSTLTPEITTEENKGLPREPKKEAEKEHQYSFSIFFILLVIAGSILLVHLLIQTKFHYLPESVAVVLLGALLGLILQLLAKYKLGNWQTEEHFPPTMFFLILLPPIIFESGYNLHKGNFFQNIGTILLFAIFGTVISAVIVGGGIYLLGRAQVAYKLELEESFAFGSLISAVDPVATLAIFQAIDVDPVLYMLVFGESILNDAVAIVLTNTVLGLSEFKEMSPAATFFTAVGHFCMMFFASAAIGIAFGLISAMLLKFIDLRKTPSLEFGMMLVFSYAPYGLAEGIHLSGIMAILFCGVVMAHYTHFNLSPVTQITVQQTFRTIAFIAETCVFAYLGLAIFSFKHTVQPALVIWSIALILLGRAFNIFPLSFLANYFREHKITKKMQFIMWFSGLRGAIAFALSLHMDIGNEEKRQVLVTTTLIIILFTVLILGGSTMPIMKCLNAEKRRRVRKGKEVTLSKTKEMGETIDSEHLSEITESEDVEVHITQQSTLTGFMKLDKKYLRPFFTRRLTQQEVRDGRTQMNNLTNQWYQEVRNVPSESEDEQEEFVQTR
ncbi:DgyrCDS6711 [Dimorphilus gyrociliatus]|uniref:Sodium/hydrogen exchanger n=1 Tax=Dimorphilus gyrociliatus TaxID=2664684 RepID=A0A7I8VNZ3_9ANNE|nr:DgyrCDS6711 [Dimorphilus gyrociliatus]